MTLTDRLAAIGVELDVIHEYQDWTVEEDLLHAYVGGTKLDFIRKDLADAAIAALVGELEEKEHYRARAVKERDESAANLDTLGHDYNALRALLEAVESARNEWREKAQQAQDDNQRLRRLFGMMPRGEE